MVPPPRPRPAPAIPLTEARARLFTLVDDVVAGRRDRVALSRRGVDERVLLVRARDYERMQAELAELRKRVRVAEPLRLWGIATVVGEVDDILREIRREENEQFEARWKDILGDAPPDLDNKPDGRVDEQPARRDPAPPRRTRRKAGR